MPAWRADLEIFIVLKPVRFSVRAFFVSAAFGRFFYWSLNMATLMRVREVMAATGLSRSGIYSKMNPKDRLRYDPTFPKSVKISDCSVAWVREEVMQWIESRIDASRNQHQQGGAA